VPVPVRLRVFLARGHDSEISIGCTAIISKI
jgi:hypothetical protein